MILTWSRHVPFRIRVFFRGTFLLLAMATLVLALTALREEKAVSYASYSRVFDEHAAQITAILRHPAGQLALMNPPAVGTLQPPRRPIVLPFAGIDFDDRFKAHTAVEMAGCLVPYPSGADLCVAVGNNPFVGGFIYAVGRFTAGPLVAHKPGERDLAQAHRLRVTVTMHNQVYRWLAPLETVPGTHPGIIGRLTGFPLDASGVATPRPNREFRGWLWQDGTCLDERSASAPDCPRGTFYSVRLPVPLINESLYQIPRPVWPPPDLTQTRVHVEILEPGNAPALFDSDAPSLRQPFSLEQLRPQLLAGEVLRIRARGEAHDLVTIRPDSSLIADAPRLIRSLIARLPVGSVPARLERTEVIETPLRAYEVEMSADVRSADRELALVATRVGLIVAAMLGAILAAWLLLEIRIIRRITALTLRVASVKAATGGVTAPDPPSFTDLEGRDELGLLAQVFGGLLQRVAADAKREQLRAEQERNTWHALGHEILSPLQSLKALHSAPGDLSSRYIERMRKAVQLLYGSATPTDAFASRTLNVQTLDIAAFLLQVAENVADAGIHDVVLTPFEGPLIINGDEYSLEDVMTHVLSNADRYRKPGTPIVITLEHDARQARIGIFNQGQSIDPSFLERIFEYGVTADRTRHDGHRGQGLFVARTYMAKMGGTITASNTADGVEFSLTLMIA